MSQTEHMTYLENVFTTQLTHWGLGDDVEYLGEMVAELLGNVDPNMSWGNAGRSVYAAGLEVAHRRVLMDRFDGLTEEQARAFATALVLWDMVPLPQETQEQELGKKQKVKHRILFIIDEWFARKGGISTFNSELARALADTEHVACYMPSASADEVSDASKDFVTLISSQPSVFLTDLSAQLLADVPTSLTSFDPHLIVGHDRRTGGIALELRRLHFQNAKVCVIVHTAPHAIERHKIDRKDANEIASGSEQRRETLARIVDAADFRCAVGQRLEQSTKLVVTAPAISILVLTPGAHILDKPASSGEDRFILLFGRAEDAVLKGIELAHDVACKLKEKSPYGYSWTVRGVSEGTLAAFMTRYHSFNLPLCYTTDSELIDQGFARASLVLMPSLEEGFGLVALEAIGHNRPVLISQESGVAQYLKRICPEHASHFIVSTFSPTSHKKVIDNWVAAIERIYDNWATTTEKLGIIREKLKERGSWQNTKMDFISICFKNSHVQ